MQLSDRIKKIIEDISYEVYEKEEIFSLAMLAMLSGESIFLLGKPGIAKSLIARRMKFALRNASCFEYLMNKFSTPEEIYGPIDIKGLQEGKYIRVIKGYLPAVEIGFLDEIWKAGPSIQNTLLTIINEKIFRNGGEDVKVPLNLLISASNELPAEGEGLEALFDRFIIRYIAKPLQDSKNFESLIVGSTSLDANVDEDVQITAEELSTWKREITKVSVSRVVLDFIHYFRNKMEMATNGEAYISDRRWKKIAGLMKTSAYFNDRSEVDIPDLFVIPFCIWDNELQEQEYREIFNQAFLEKFGMEWRNEKQNLLNKVDEIGMEIDQAETQYLRLTPYNDPWKGRLSGTYYHLNIQTSDENQQFALIAASDWNKLVNVPDTPLKVEIHFGANLQKYNGSATFDAQFHKADQINLISINQKASIENDNPVEYNNKMQEFNASMQQLEKDVKDISAKMYKSYKKYTNEKCIFFEKDYYEKIAEAFDIVSPNESNGEQEFLTVQPDNEVPQQVEAVAQEEFNDEFFKD